MIVVFCLGLSFIKSESIRAAEASDTLVTETSEGMSHPSKVFEEQLAKITELLAPLRLEEREFETIGTIIHETFSDEYNKILI